MKLDSYKFYRDIKQYFGNNISFKQYFTIAVIILILIGFITGFIYLTNNKYKKTLDLVSEKVEPVKIEMASEAIDPEKMWRNYFEDTIESNHTITTKQLAAIEKSLVHEYDEVKNNNQKEISDLRNELESTRNELKDTLNDLMELQKKELETPEKQIPHISLLNINDDDFIESPKDSKFYIPETSYITGFLMGGLAVSTSIGSPSEPVPVIVRITDNGNLPSNFSANIKECRILGSGYGDISSERAIIRAEVLVCENKELEEIITTKISGIIYGDDGMNGIKGKVVDMSPKHIKNAAIGGILSGFSNSMKSEGDLFVGTFGAARSKEQKMEDKLRNNSVSGFGNAAEKIADYYIKKAERMSPILFIPGGTKVDVVFTKGTYLGALDVTKKIHNEKR